MIKLTEKDARFIIKILETHAHNVQNNFDIINEIYEHSNELFEAEGKTMDPKALNKIGYYQKKETKEYVQSKIIINKAISLLTEGSIEYQK